LTAFDAQALLSEKFETKLAADPAKYVGTVADCGDSKLNLNHYNACLGLRNIRLKTLEQTEAIVDKIKKRREEIKTVITEGSNFADAGKLQHSQFVLQGLQAQLQNDAMELDALRYGYKQREHMYEMQMAESRRASDTRPASGTAGGGINFGPVKFNVVK
jgi:predicted RNase H-like nuclease (RuvC/YqgF family)